ncbi:hypothetical protein WJX84_011699 [Apatococcus fuscideae]|uniref:N-acetyltransferase domain-containing protein n=1 Tax=Apatococcus fuscideae TaxID=2026836 RepID=A0AAW1TBE8_9CHLO
MQYPNGGQAGPQSRQLTQAVSAGHFHVSGCPTIGQSRQVLRCPARTWRGHSQPAYYRLCSTSRVIQRQFLHKQTDLNDPTGLTEVTLEPPATKAKQELRHATDASIQIRPAETAHDLWRASGLCTRALFPGAGQLLASLLRLNKMAGMQMSRVSQAPKEDLFRCLLAQSHASSFQPSSQQQTSQMQQQPQQQQWQPASQAASVCSNPQTIVRSSTIRQLWRRFSHARVAGSLPDAGPRILGTVMVDALPQHAPAAALPGSQVCWSRSEDEQRDWCAPKLGYISDLAVSRGHRRQGIGLQLLYAAEQVSRDWGCATTTLHCSPANIPARRLYHKAGYVEQQQGSRQGGLLPGWCQLAHPLQLLAKPL